MTPVAVVHVKEDSTKEVSRAVYRAIEDSPEIVDLLDAGVVSLVRSKGVPYGIKARGWVGQALLGETAHLILTEKVPGTLQGLLRFALPEDVRIAASTSPVGTGVALMGVLCKLFLDELENALRYGRDRHYVVRRGSGPLLRGRLDVPATMRHRVAGRRDLLAYSVTELTADTLVNRSIAFALRAVDSYAGSAGGVEAGLAVRARQWQILFSDARTEHLARYDRELRRRAYDAALLDPAVEGSLRRSLLYAQAIVLSYGVWPSDLYQATGEVPASFFINLSDLFEDAVRGALRTWLGASMVRQGSALKVQVLTNVPDRYTADPDFVIDHPAGRIVGDCKYKAEAMPAHPDLYQLLAHSRALGAKRAVLVYAAETLRWEQLGETAEGLSVCVAYVRAGQLAADLPTALAGLGLIPFVEAAA